MSNGGKKRLSPLAWIGIGCGCLLLLAAVVAVGLGLFVFKKAKDVAADFQQNPALAAARLIVKADPDLEEVAVDEQAGTITIRRKSSGEEVTVSFEDIKNGRIGFSTDKGEVQIQTEGSGGGLAISGKGDKGAFRLQAGEGGSAQVPDWVPRYPGATPSGTYLLEGEGGKVSGGFQVTLTDPVDVVLEQYRQDLKKGGFTVSINTFAGDGGTQAGTLSAEDAASGRTVQVMVGQEGASTSAVVAFSTGGQ